MTNKESIQAAHLEAINEHPSEIYSSELCTTITAEAIKDYEEWKALLDYDADKDKYWILGGTEWYGASELPQLFLNQKAKI